MNPLIDNRRLELCVDLEGVPLHERIAGPGMTALVSTLRERHAVLVSSAAPENEARTLLRRAGLSVDKQDVQTLHVVD